MTYAQEPMQEAEKDLSSPEASSDALQPMMAEEKDLSSPEASSDGMEPMQEEDSSSPEASSDGMEPMQEEDSSSPEASSDGMEQVIREKPKVESSQPSKISEPITLPYTAKDQDLFELAKRVDNSEIYFRYLVMFPGGKYLQEISKRWLALLENNSKQGKNPVISMAECVNAYVVTSSKLNIRSAPRTSSPLKGSFQKGDRVCMMNRKGKWVHVAKGWVHATYLESIPPALESLDIYQQYIRTVTIEKYIQQALMFRNQYQYEVARRENSVEGYDRFLAEYPNDKRKSEILLIREELRFEQAVASHQVRAYDTYLEEYPKGTYAEECMRLRMSAKYEWALREQTIEAYDEYLNEYPEGEKNYYIKLLRMRLMKNKAEAN
ncbi:SH3 domain-containing protein [Deltaproteobacteria bacterium TL4]